MSYSIKEQEVSVPVGGDVFLPGSLRIPKEGTKGLVVFVHGSGSSRHSPRNTYVASVLENEGLGTLLFDLLTPEEDSIYKTRFDISLLANRVVSAVEWLNSQKETANMKVGLFGASTGGGAAIEAACNLEDKGNHCVQAVISRGGRPDLAKNSLPKMKVPTLLLVGGRDHVVIELNKKAFSQMTHLKEKELKVIEGATHLFEEPGTLEAVAETAASFFVRHLMS